MYACIAWIIGRISCAAELDILGALKIAVGDGNDGDNGRFDYTNVTKRYRFIKAKCDRPAE